MRNTFTTLQFVKLLKTAGYKVDRTEPFTEQRRKLFDFIKENYGDKLPFFALKSDMQVKSIIERI